MSAEKEKIKGEYTGRWNARFTIKLLNNKSKRIFKRGFNSKKEALEYEKKVILDNSLGSNISFKVAIHQYLEFKKLRIKELTYMNMSNILNSITYFDNLLISDITPIQISNFQNDLLRKYKGSSIRTINAYVKMLFTWCVRYKNLASNPFDMVDRLKLETKKRMDIMCSSNDGFYISEQDFLLRGYGDILGYRQSGEARFKILNIQKDYELLKSAIKYVDKILMDDFNFEKEENQVLKRNVDEFIQNLSENIIMN